MPWLLCRLLKQALKTPKSSWRPTNPGNSKGISIVSGFCDGPKEGAMSSGILSAL